MRASSASSRRNGKTSANNVLKMNSVVDGIHAIA